MEALMSFGSGKPMVVRHHLTQTEVLPQQFKRIPLQDLVLFFIQEMDCGCYVGHGLGVTPDMIIIKPRGDNTANWMSNLT
jgi:hypothetical protein